jgi:protoporphyrinogen oxidase
LYDGILGLWILRESSIGPRPRHIQDESVGDFIMRRTGGNRAIADRFVSAVLHGIYAGDVWQLSMASLLPGPWYMERNSSAFGRETGPTVGVIDGYLRRMVDDKVLMSKQQWHMFDDLSHEKWDVEFLQNLLQKPGMFYLKPGMSALVQELEKKLATFKNVEIKLNTPMEKLEYLKEEKKITVSTSTQAVLPPFNCG